MGLVTGLVALAILGVVVIFFYDVIIDFIEDRRDDAELLDFQRMHDIPDGLCDLDITFFAEVTLPLFTFDLNYNFGGSQHPEVAQFEWTCRSGTQLFNFDRLAKDLEGLFFVFLGDERQEMNIKIKSLDGSGNFRTCPLYDPLCKNFVWETDREYPEPVQVEKSFIIRNIPLNNYDIEIFVEGNRVNFNPVDVPIVYQVRN